MLLTRGPAIGTRSDPPLHPRLGLHLHSEVVPGEGVYLLGDSEPVWLSAPIHAELIPLLDGRRSIEAIFTALRGRHDPAEAFAALDRLRTQGLLAEGPPPEDAASTALWEALGARSDHVRGLLQQATISITTLGSLSSAPWARALHDQLHDQLRGVGLAVGEPGTVALVLTEDHLDPALAEIDARARADDRPWLLVRPQGTTPWLGPLFVPGRTGCWHCLAHRLRGHRRLETHLRRVLGRPPGRAPAAALPSTIAAVAGLVATELAKWLALGHGPLLGAVLTLELATLERRSHALVRRPQCPACGRPPAIDRTPDRPALAAADPPIMTLGQGGGYRTVSPEQTVARLQHHISPITGIIGHVEPRLAEHGPITPVYVTDHSFAEMDAERWFLREGFRKRSGGKGTTVAQALASALGESIERYCGVFQGDEPRVWATRAALGPAAIHPNACLGYSERQYAERERWNAAGTKVRQVPEPFHDDLPLEWTPLWSVVDGAIRHLPTGFCYYGHPAQGPDGRPQPRVAVADSNGCAAGSTRVEAVLQGLLELVERDCVALWWYNRLRRPGVALESFEAPYVLELREHYRSLERELWAIDITSDLGIPAFAAVSRRVDQPREDVLLGFGAHVDARVALLRAMTEVNQSLPSVPGPKDGPSAPIRGDNPEATRWWTAATVATEPYLRPDPVEPLRTLADHGPPPSGSIAHVLQRCVERLHAHGLPTLVLDQSRPDVELAVARVVVPGLRHFWPRFGPGRLYQVPVAQGWRRTPATEAELNPFAIYF